MKLILLVVISAIYVASAHKELSEAEQNEVFGDFLNKFKIRLGRSDDTNEAKKNLINNYYDVEDHNEQFNRGNRTFTKALHEYSHLSYEELVRVRMGAIEPPQGEQIKINNQIEKAGRAAIASAPAYVNWVEKGIVTQVVNQGGCGSCWIFGATGAIESAIAKKYKKLQKLSEQELLECITDPWNLGYAGCRGGWDDWVYNHVKTKTNGITLSSTYPYTGNDRTTCKLNRAKAAYTLVKGYVSLPAGNEENLKAALAANGPISVTMFFPPDASSIGTGIFNDPNNQCLNKPINHLVLLVGYGTQPCNGKPACDYWLIKNSWGPNWGDKGYIKIARNQNNLCKISDYAKYPTV